MVRLNERAWRIDPPSPVIRTVGSRTLRINWVLPRAGLAGGIKSNRLIAEAMVRRGHDVTIAFLDDPKPWPHPWQVGRWIDRWRRESQLRGKPRHHLVNSTARLVPVHGLVVRADDMPDADVTIATWWETRHWIESWPESKGIKAYFIRHYEIHGGDPERVRQTYRMSGLKLVIARWLQRLMAQEFGDPNAVLVPNGVDWSQFDSVPRSRNVIPTVGMLYGKVKWKGADTAFEAIRLAQKQLPQLRVLAFGSHPLDPGHQLPANFEFHLRPSQDTIPRLYRGADCWIVPSTLEGFGMPGLEAAACRCPIVSTRCGGPEDYVEDGISGRLVPVSDPDAMAEAIIEVVTQGASSWRDMSEASYSIARHFDWDRSAAILENALLEATDQAQSFRPLNLPPLARAS